MQAASKAVEQRTVAVEHLANKERFCPALLRTEKKQIRTRLEEEAQLAQPREDERVCALAESSAEMNAKLERRIKAAENKLTQQRLVIDPREPRILELSRSMPIQGFTNVPPSHLLLWIKESVQSLYLSITGLVK